MRVSLVSLAAALVVITGTGEAFASLQACNETKGPIAVAIANSDGENWISQGWWTIRAGACATVLGGPLQARFYYLRAVDLELGGGWGGDRYFCTTQRSFAITGREKCEERGYERTGFFEVDTQDAADYTHILANPEGR